MGKKKVIKQVKDEEHGKLIMLLGEKTPEERQRLLRNIDNILCSMLDLDQDDLPWLNPNKHEEKWEKIMKNLRLVIGKLEYESEQKNRTIH